MPGRRQKNGLSDENLDYLVAILDDFIRIPGTSIRVGLDPLLGLIPGIGDVLTGVLSFLLVFAGWQRGLSRVTLLRMVMNIAIDTLGGLIPLVGDAFDALWKSNRMNYHLLRRAQSRPSRWHTTGDWLFLSGIVLLLSALVAVPIVLAALLLHFIFK